MNEQNQDLGPKEFPSDIFLGHGVRSDSAQWTVGITVLATHSKLSLHSLKIFSDTEALNN